MITKYTKRIPSRLAGLELFAGCTRAQLDRIDSLVTGVTVPEGRILIVEDTPGREFVIIAEGTARVTRTAPHGEPSDIAELSDGAFVGEMALLDQTPRSATVTAATDLTVYVSNVSEFREILRTAPSVAAKVLEASTTRSQHLATFDDAITSEAAAEAA